MRPDIIIKIRNTPYLDKYLKYHSYWYKELIRNPESIKLMGIEAKKEFKLTSADKISKMNEKLQLIRTFLEVLK